MDTLNTVYNARLEEARKENQNQTEALYQEYENLSQKLHPLKTEKQTKLSEMDYRIRSCRKEIFVEKEQEELKMRIQSYTSTLTHSKSTLQGWLKENHKGWEETIGKLCDEAILWQTNLSPQKAEGNSFYGIQIDLNVIERHIKSIDDYNKEKEEKEQPVRI